MSGFVRHRLLRLGDDGERPRLALRRLDQHQVIGKLDEHAVMRLSGEEPHALADRRQPRRSAAAGAAGFIDVRRRRDVAERSIDRLLARLDLVGREVVDLAGDLRGQLHAVDVLVVGERRRHHHVTEIRVIGPARDRQRQARRIDRHRPRAIAEREIRLAHVADRADVGDAW